MCTVELGFTLLTSCRFLPVSKCKYIKIDMRSRSRVSSFHFLSPGCIILTVQLRQCQYKTLANCSEVNPSYFDDARKNSKEPIIF